MKDIDKIYSSKIKFRDKQIFNIRDSSKSHLIPKNHNNYEKSSRNISSSCNNDTIKIPNNEDYNSSFNSSFYVDKPISFLGDNTDVLNTLLKNSSKMNKNKCISNSDIFNKSESKFKSNDSSSLIEEDMKENGKLKPNGISRKSRTEKIYFDNNSSMPINSRVNSSNLERDILNFNIDKADSIEILETNLNHLKKKKLQDEIDNSDIFKVKRTSNKHIHQIAQILLYINQKNLHLTIIQD